MEVFWVNSLLAFAYTLHFCHKMIHTIYTNSINQSACNHNYLAAVAVSFTYIEFMLTHFIQVYVINKWVLRDWKIEKEKVLIRSNTNSSIVKIMNEGKLDLILNKKQKNKIKSYCWEYIFASISDQTEILYKNGLIGKNLKDLIDKKSKDRNNILHWNIWAINMDINTTGVTAFLKDNEWNIKETKKDNTKNNGIHITEHPSVKALIWAATWQTEDIYKQHYDQILPVIRELTTILERDN